MKKFKILIPVFNDWQSLSKLLSNIDNEIANLSHNISIIIIDDASTFDRQLEIENLSNINSIIDVIQSSNPNCIIIIEQMAPGHSEIMTTELTNFWNQIQEEVLDIAENKTTINSQVIAIDMFTGFGDNFLADDVHYNEDGAEFISDRYYKTLRNLLD